MCLGLAVLGFWLTSPLSQRNPPEKAIVARHWFDIPCDQNDNSGGGCLWHPVKPVFPKNCGWNCLPSVEPASLQAVADQLPASAVSVGTAAVARVPVVGIVGGVGSGKSAVVRALAQAVSHSGAGCRLFVIDADQIGHQQLGKAEIVAALVQQFGMDILEDGVISRARLGSLVFQDSPSGRQGLQWLNQIVRPGIRSQILLQLQAIPQDVDVVILDAALLLEAGWAEHCDALIWIETPLQQRQQRVMATRGWTVQQHRLREASQWDLARKRAACDFVVDNSGSLETAAAELQKHLQQICRSGFIRVPTGTNV